METAELGRVRGQAGQRKERRKWPLGEGKEVEGNFPCHSSSRQDKGNFKMWSTTITLLRELKYCPIKEVGFFLHWSGIRIPCFYVFRGSCSLNSWYKKTSVWSSRHFLKVHETKQAHIPKVKIQAAKTEAITDHVFHVMLTDLWDNPICDMRRSLGAGNKNQIFDLKLTTPTGSLLCFFKMCTGHRARFKDLACCK